MDKKLFKVKYQQKIVTIDRNTKKENDYVEPFKIVFEYFYCFPENLESELKNFEITKIHNLQRSLNQNVSFDIKEENIRQDKIFVLKDEIKILKKDIEYKNPQGLNAILMLLFNVEISLLSRKDYKLLVKRAREISKNTDYWSKINIFE